MAPSTDAPSQFKQKSRKGKRAWRKHVDVTDIQDGLETVRDEVIKGGIIAEKASNELFTVDTAGDKAIQADYNRAHKPLRADEILAQRSAMPAVDSRKRAASKVTDGVLEPASKRPRKISHKELTRLRKIALGSQSVGREVIRQPSAPDHDPWADGAAPEQDPMFSFLEPPQPVREPKTLKRASVSLAASGKEIPAVKQPEAQLSYNPQSTVYFDALSRAGEEEVQAEKQRLAEAAEDQRRQDLVDRAQEEGERDDSDEESAWEGLESEVEGGSEWLARRRPERKTQAQRNKIKRRKEAEQRAAAETKERQRRRQAGEIKRIAAEIKAREEERRIAAADKDDSADEPGDDRVLRRRRLGKAPLPEPSLELVLPRELQDSLRLLKPEGNLLKDRYRSMLVRGKAESRRAITQPRKARRTTTEKWSYKDWKLK